MAIEFDPGPSQRFAQLFSALPDYGLFKQYFWYDWGPVFYRGRLDGTARVICIASDPGPTECLVRRTLVGDAGQRVQGFLAKLGLTRSYVCVNAFAYALFPSQAKNAEPLLLDAQQAAWRNGVLDELVQLGKPEVVIAFGREAQLAVDSWPGGGGLHVEKIPHPSSHDEKDLLTKWSASVAKLRNLVTTDPGGNVQGPNYGATFLESDYAPIPRLDLPFGTPNWIGDDAWGRKASPRHNNCVRRPDSKNEPHLNGNHFLIWQAPP